MKKLLATCALVTCLIAQAFAVIPVTDGGAILQRQAIWAKELGQWIEQAKRLQAQITQSKAIYDKSKESLEYIQLLQGNWKGTLLQLLHRETDKYTRGNVNMDAAGWEMNDAKWRKVIAQRSAIGALKELRGVMDGKLAPSNVRESIEAGWGVVPMTADGVRVEAMHQEAATVMMATGQQQVAMQEKQANIDHLDKEISGAFGLRTPVEVERLKAKQNKEQQDLSALQVTAQGYTNRLLAQLVLNESAKISNAELGRLSNVRANQEGMSLMQFSPVWRPKNSGPGVE